MVNELPKVKIEVDFEDLWSDMIAAYKGRMLNESTQVKISLQRSAAIDASGVRRQAYTQLFHAFACNSFLHHFDGEENHL